MRSRPMILATLLLAAFLVNLDPGGTLPPAIPD
jgi:hypothetical protein